MLKFIIQKKLFNSLHKISNWSYRVTKSHYFSTFRIIGTYNTPTLHIITIPYNINTIKFKKLNLKLI